MHQMVPNICNVAIITKVGSSEADGAAMKVSKLLTKSNVQVHSVLPLVLNDAVPISPEQLKDIKLDLVFAIGGDGTTLRAFRAIPGNVPVFSINSGGKTRMMLRNSGEWVFEGKKVKP